MLFVVYPIQFTSQFLAVARAKLLFSKTLSRKLLTIRDQSQGSLPEFHFNLFPGRLEVEEEVR